MSQEIHHNFLGITRMRIRIPGTQLSAGIRENTRFRRAAVMHRVHHLGENGQIYYACKR